MELLSNQDNQEVVIHIENLKKKYRLGVIGSGTLQGDIQSFLAKIRKKEDPNQKIGQKNYERAEDFWALRGVSLDIHKGETIGVIGGNGAGKSTLLKILSRVTAPTDGKIYVKGKVASMLEVGTGFHKELTGRENIYLNGAIMGMSEQEVDERLEEIVKFAEVEKFIDTPVKRYSSGMYVKLAFSVAAHLNADILIMDEVLAVGDARFQKKCVDKMLQLAACEGKTVLLVSHNMNTISSLCSRCVLLEQGEIQYVGETSQAIEMYYQHRYGENVVKYTLADKERPKNQSFPMRMKYIEFMDKENAEFGAGEVMRTKLSWESGACVSDVCFRITICYQGTPMGTFISKTIEGNIEKDALYETEICLKTDMLVKGSYTASVGIYQYIEKGVYSPLDFVEGAFAFKIVEETPPKSTWKRRWWGAIVLEDAVVAENKKLSER